MLDRNNAVNDLLTNLMQSKGIRMTFIYGPMGSGKSSFALELIERCHARGERPICVVAGTKPRDGIVSRGGGNAEAVTVVQSLSAGVELSMGARIVVDEAQFLPAADVRRFQHLSQALDCRISFFGLYWRADGQLFEGTKALLDHGADMIPIPHDLRCWCGAPAVADVLRSGQQPSVTPRYMSACARHRGAAG